MNLVHLPEAGKPEGGEIPPILACPVCQTIVAQWPGKSAGDRCIGTPRTPCPGVLLNWIEPGGGQGKPLSALEVVDKLVTAMGPVSRFRAPRQIIDISTMADHNKPRSKR